MADPHDATAHVTAALPAHTEDHDHGGTPTQKLLAANAHESPAADTHHADVHSNAKHSDPQAAFYRLKSGLWFCSSPFGVNGGPTLDSLRLTWFPVSKTATLDRIALWVQTGLALSVVRLGIYRDDGSGYPGARVLDAGTVDSSSAGLKTITISQELTPDLYWIGGVAQTAVATLSIGQTTFQPFFGSMGSTVTPASGGYSGEGNFAEAGVSGALPANFTTSKASIANAPRVFLRVA